MMVIFGKTESDRPTYICTTTDKVHAILLSELNSFIRLCSETIEIEKEKNATKWCVMATTVAAAVEVSTSFDLNEYSFYSIEVS